MIIKRIDPMSVAKITGIIAAVFGLIAGILYFAFGSWFGHHYGAMGMPMADQMMAQSMSVPPMIPGAHMRAMIVSKAQTISCSHDRVTWKIDAAKTV